MIGATIARSVASAAAAIQANILGLLSASNGSTLVSFLQAGAGAVVRAVQDKLRDRVSVLDFGAVGDGVTDDTAAITAAATYAFTNNRVLYFPGRPFKITAALDWTAYPNITVRGEGWAATPAQAVGSRIIQFTNDTPILRVTARPDIAGISLLYNAQQTLAHTNSRGIEFNKLSGGAIRRVRVYRAHISYGIPQVDFGGLTNFVFNTLLDLESWDASHTHLDLRNYNGGGTNVKVPKLYINGSGSLDFATPGQSAAYAVRGASWSGYELGAISIDGLQFTERMFDLTNCYYAIDTLRYEACTCKKDNDGWFVAGGGDTSGDIRLLDVKNCRALLADVATGTYLFRLNAALYNLRVRYTRLSADCSFTTPLMRALTLTGVAPSAASDVRFGPINNAAAGFSSATWSDITGLTPYVVREWDGQDVERTWKHGRNAVTFRWRYDAAAPVAGNWNRGDLTWNTAPSAGAPLGWVCAVTGTPGTWAPFGHNAIEGSKPYDPGNLADGAGETTLVGCAGAAMGDFVTASFSLDLQGVVLTAYVSSAGNVAVRFQNETGGVVDLAAGTLKVRVHKQ